ncbi:MAG: hypothetical protein GY796_12020 [Chloroflexi bacterium]|nr:hypothetical protein [Chloroflexota bacterium]
MLAENEFKQIRDYIIKILPDIIRQEPEVATTIEGILAEHFPRRDELAQMLAEVREHRQETKENFEQVDQRFEQVDQRFEQVDQRFEQVDQRFDEVHQEQLGMKRDIIQLRHGQELIIKKIDGQEKWLRFVTGQMRNDKGQTLEDLFAEALRYGLNNPDLKAESIHLRQTLDDADHLVFPSGFTSEVDLIIENGKISVLEVKATAKPGDVELFALKIQVIAAQNQDKEVEGIFVSLAASDEVRAHCDKHGIQLID